LNGWNGFNQPLLLASDLGPHEFSSKGAERTRILISALIEA
jgi:hypothetical protein